MITQQCSQLVDRWNEIRMHFIGVRQEEHFSQFDFDATDSLGFKGRPLLRRNQTSHETSSDALDAWVLGGEFASGGRVAGSTFTM